MRNRKRKEEHTKKKRTRRKRENMKAEDRHWRHTSIYREMINVPPGALFSLLLPRNCIEHDTTRDGSDRIGYDRPLWGLSTACAAMVCAEIPPVIASPLLYRPVRVLDTHHDLYEDIVDFRVQTGINIFYRYISHVCVMKVEGNGNPNIILRSTYLMVSYVIPGTLLWRKCVLPGAAVSIPVRHACMRQSVHASRVIEEKHGRRKRGQWVQPVSYTHLTLPTIYSV